MVKVHLRLLTVLICLVFLSCDRETRKLDTVNIKGVWSSFSFDIAPIEGFDSEHFINFNYGEFYITSKSIFNYGNMMGFVSPRNYETRGDSLFWSFNTKKEDFEYLGKVFIKSSDCFAIYEGKDSIFFYKMKKGKDTFDKIVLENEYPHIDHKDSIQFFTQAFLNRSYAAHEKLKKKN